MKTLLLSAFGVVLLSGCILGGLEKTTTETRDEVIATKEGAQLGLSLEVCLGEHIVAACKPFLLKLPEDRLADYMGIPIRVMGEESARRTFEGVELDLPNVVYVGEKGDFDFRVELAAMDRKLYDTFRMATQQLIADLNLKSLKSGVTAAEMDTNREYTRRLIYVGTAILGAVELRNLASGLDSFAQRLGLKTLGLPHLQAEANVLTGSLPQILSQKERDHQASQLRTLARSVSLTESEVDGLNSLLELRMRVR